MATFRLSYWLIPLFSAAVWFGTLLAMLVVWLAQGRPHYPWTHDEQSIAYISDIGATGWGQPLFIAGSAVAIWSFFSVFCAERWLRHKGRLAINTSQAQKWLSICATIAAFVGSAGLTILTCCNTNRFNHVHNSMLVVFIAGYVVSAIFICAEYQRLGIAFRQYQILAISFWVKLGFIFVEVALAISFGVMSYQKHYNRAAVLEWIVSLIFIFYMASFVADFIPAISSKHDRFPTMEEINRDIANENGPSMSGGPTFVDIHHGRDSTTSTQPIMYPSTGAQANPNAPNRF